MRSWAPQPGPQTEAICADWCPELLFGGAAGGGKSDFLLGDYLQDVTRYGKAWRGIIFRRTYRELEELVGRSHEIYPQTGAKWTASDSLWKWRNGAQLRLRYLERDLDVTRYQGHAYTWIGWDELTQWPSAFAYRYMRSRLRSATSVPTKRIRASANPGGKGHLWVKREFVDPAPLGYVPMRDPVTGMDRMFVPSRLNDNAILLAADPGYAGRLAGMGSPELVRAMLEGDWSVISGAYFPEFDMAKHVITPRELPSHWTRLRAFDWGSAKPFCALWLAVADGTTDIPAGSVVVYREFYGSTGEPNVGLRMPTEQIAAGILSREALGEDISLSVCDPSILSKEDGPSRAERMAPIPWHGADNSRVAGWDQLRSRLVGMDKRPRLYIFSTCVNLIRTLPALQHDSIRPEDLDSDGEDHCFVADTLVRTRAGARRLGDLVGQVGEVLGPDGGWHSFHGARLTRRQARVVRLTFSNGTEVVCTPDHRFLTRSGWVQACDLGDALGYALIATEGIPCLSSSTLTAARNLPASGSISAAATSSGRGAACIEQSGKLRTGLFRRALMSTTGIMTGATTSLPTSSYWPGATIWRCMGQKVLHEWCNTFLRRAWPRLNGTEAMPVESGIVGTMKPWLPLSMLGLPGFASNAAPASKASSAAGTKLIGSAPMPARRLGVGQAASTMSGASAPTAAPPSWSTDTTGSLPAAGPVEARCVRIEDAGRADVFCLTVPEGEAFALASGIVVHNCADTLRYGLMARPWTAPIPEPAKRRDSWARAFEEAYGEQGGDESWKTT